jgi:Bacterial PH domain
VEPVTSKSCCLPLWRFAVTLFACGTPLIYISMLFEKIQLEADEKVITVIRKHWWVLARQLIFVTTLALLPLFIPLLFSIIGSITPLVNTNPVTTAISTHLAELSFLYTFWLLLLWMFLANFWTDYYLDLWAVTNKRVVLVDQRGFFRRFISSFRLERLQDMNIEINGVIPTLLDFGTIEAQTAGGSNEKFIGYEMPHPRDIKALIVETTDVLIQRQL